MPATERTGTQREVILNPREQPLSSPEDLTEACLPALAARLWATCCWSATMAGAWKIGDHRVMVVEVCPDPATCLYVQFWSEPGELVDAEVCSGEWNPGAVKYIRQQQRTKIEALGYRVGGQAHNFQKKLLIETSAQADTVAREVLGIFFDVFGYRGQWPLELKWHRGERAQRAPVHSSLTPGDFARLVAHLDFEIEGRSRRQPVIHLRHGKRRFDSVLSGGVPDENLYSIVVLQASLTSPRAIDHALLERINAALRFARVSRADPHTLILSMPLRFDGGVTMDWMVNSFQHWFAAWRACERLLKSRRTARALKAKPRQSTHAVH